MDGELWNHHHAGSGILFFHQQGIIAMMEIIAWGAGKVVNPICAANFIPVVNFGVELEVSCTSGNYMQIICSGLL
jgi:hypothetical protein